jgi:hypothetical protein
MQFPLLKILLMEPTKTCIILGQEDQHEEIRKCGIPRERCLWHMLHV